MEDNNGLLYYKKNYTQSTGIIVINSIQINTKLESSGIFPIIIPGATNTFRLETTYPGLLMGTGYTHYAKGDDNAYKIGFFFDHTTGMPVIPGSSLKGVLRSVFPQFDKYDINKIENAEIPKNTNSMVKAKWISSLFEELNKADFNPNNFISTYYQPNEDFTDFKLIHDFELELFDTAKNIFYDVVPIKINGNNIGNTSKLFANDYLAPHEDPLINPDPLKFLKVLPKVVYQFTFKLHKSKIDSKLTAKKLELLFKKILLTIGIGAKTNVGYGQFTDADSPLKKKTNKTPKDIIQQKEDKLKKILEKQAETEKNKSIAEKRLVKGAKIECVVIGKEKKYYTFGVDWDKNLKFQKKIANIKTPLEIGDKVEIEIIEDYFIVQDVIFLNTITKT